MLLHSGRYRKCSILTFWCCRDQIYVKVRESKIFLASPRMLLACHRFGSLVPDVARLKPCQFFSRMKSGIPSYFTVRSKGGPLSRISGVGTSCLTSGHYPKTPKPPMFQMWESGTSFIRLFKYTLLCPASDVLAHLGPPWDMTLSCSSMSCSFAMVKYPVHKSHSQWWTMRRSPGSSGSQSQRSLS